GTTGTDCGPPAAPARTAGRGRKYLRNKGLSSGPCDDAPAFFPSIDRAAWCPAVPVAAAQAHCKTPGGEIPDRGRPGGAAASRRSGVSLACALGQDESLGSRPGTGPG